MNVKIKDKMLLRKPRVQPLPTELSEFKVKLNQQKFFQIVVRDGWESWELWRRGVVVITTAPPHLTMPEIRFCTGSNPVHGVLEFDDGEDL